VGQRERRLLRRDLRFLDDVAFVVSAVLEAHRAVCRAEGRPVPAGTFAEGAQMLFLCDQLGAALRQALART
jgi:hypothetical protein